MRCALAVYAWVFCLVSASLVNAQPVTGAFTYQGELMSAGSPASGLHDLRFRLYDAMTGGTQVGPTLCVNDLNIIEGRFTVELDFGAVFGGAMRYLEIDVREDTGLSCANVTGFVTLSTRQRLTATPHAAFAISATNTGLFGNQSPSYYLNASNINAGTIADTRLSSNVTTLSGAQTFSGAKTFSSAPVFSSAGAPFVVSSTTRVGNLNADLLDGLDSTAFAVAGHTHDASAIVSGTLNDARISSIIPRVNISNIFSDTQIINVNTQTPLTLIGSNSGGTWVNFQNTGGGRTWNLIATGSTNGEGPGKFLLRDQTGGAVRMAIDPSGFVGLGTTSPSSRLELAQADAALRIRNINDVGGGFMQNTFATVQIGLYNPTASVWGVVPAGGQRAVLGVQNTGRVGSLTNTGLAPTWRNILDDGSGNASIVGNLSAANMPAVKHAVRTAGVDIISNDSRTVIEDITVNVPAPGFLWITTRVNVYVYTSSPLDSGVFLELKDTTTTEVLIRESPLFLGPPVAAPSMSIESDQTIQHVKPVSAGVHRFKVRVRHTGGGGGGSLRGGEITVMYFPASL